MKDLHVSVNIKKVSRIGIEKEQKTRPTLFEFDEYDKDKLFSNWSVERHGKVQESTYHGRSNNRSKTCY